MDKNCGFQIRLSVGIEEPEDLIADLERAFKIVVGGIFVLSSLVTTHKNICRTKLGRA